MEILAISNEAQKRNSELKYSMDEAFNNIKQYKENFENELEKYQLKALEVQSFEQELIQDLN